MSQRDTGRKKFSESDLSRKRRLLAPALPREEGVERPQRVTAPQAAPERGRSARRVLLQQLGRRRTLRQAILLSAILGPPMALCGEPKDLVNQKC